MPFVNDFFSSNRFKNLFGGSPSSPPMLEFGASQGPTPTGMQPSLPAAIPEFDAGSRMRELYDPSNEASQRFEELLSQYPQRESPSALRRIAAMLRDYTKGPEEGRFVFDEPNIRALEAWKNQIGPTQQAANLERQQNINERTLAYQTTQAELAQRRQEEMERKNLRNEEIKQQRADIYALRSARPNFKFDFRGTTVLVSNPDTGEVKDSGVPTTAFSKAEQMALQTEQEVKKIEARGEEARKTVAATGEEARKTKAIPTAPIAAKPLSPQQEIANQYKLAKELIARKPEYKKFVEIDDGTKTITGIRSPLDRGWYAKPTQQQYDEIQNYIYGKMQTTAPGLGSKTETKPLADPLGIR